MPSKFLIKNLSLIKKILGFIMLAAVIYLIFGMIYWGNLEKIPYNNLIIGISIGIIIIFYFIREEEKKIKKKIERMKEDMNKPSKKFP